MNSQKNVLFGPGVLFKMIKKLSVQEEDDKKIKFYKKFNEKNEDLLKENPEEFYHQQRLYVEEEMIKIKYYSSKEKVVQD